MSTRKT